MKYLIISAVICYVMTAFPITAEAQVTNKWIRVVQQSEPIDLDGCNSLNIVSGRILQQNIVETLVQKNPKNNSLMPRLATSWKRVDPLTWRFTLRQGVSFHDGAPFNAQALKASLDRTMGKGITCGNRTKFFANVALEVVPVDDHTVLLKTDKPDPILPMSMSGIYIVSPNTSIDKLSLGAIGTGPYVFDSWRAGQQILLKRNDKYWGAKPDVEGVIFMWRSESSVRAAMVEIGEADITTSIAPQDATNPKTDTSYINSETTTLNIDTTQPPLNDKRVRLALNYALDREAIRTNIFSKDYKHATQIVIPSIPGHNDAIDKQIFLYDPEKAKKLLAEARADGVLVDTEITLLGNQTQYPNAADVIESAYANYKAVGLNVKLQQLDLGRYRAYNSKPFPEGRGPTIMQKSHDNNLGDPVFSVFHRYACAGSNSKVCDPALDKEIERVTELAGVPRTRGWQGIFRTLYEDIVPDVMLYHMVGYARVSPRIIFIPDTTTNNELRVQEITFAKK